MMAVKRRPRGPAGVYRLSTGLKIAVAHLLGRPGLTHSDIAQILGCCTSTVQSVARIYRNLPGYNVELEEYRRQIRDRVPASKRVQTIAAAVGMVKSNPFVALRGVEMADTLLGLHPKVANTQESAPCDAQPMFILPPGTNVQVNIQQNVDRRQIGGAQDGD